MKKKRIYGLMIIFLIAIIAIVINYHIKQEKTKNQAYGLLERKGESPDSREWKDVQNRSKTLLANLEQDPSDTKSSL